MTRFEKLLLGCCYRPPDSSVLFVSDLRNSITHAIRTCPAESIFLFGDFNLSSINWKQLSSTCRLSSDFIALTLDFNLSQIVSQPTRDSNIPDLVLTTVPNTVEKITYLDGFSDHKLMQLNIKVPSRFSGPTTKIIRDYNRGNYSVINAELETFLVSVLLPRFSNRTVQDNWDLFKNKLITLVSQHVPLIKITNYKRNPWFTKSLNQLRNKKKRLYASAKRASTPIS